MKQVRDLKTIKWLVFGLVLSGIVVYEAVFNFYYKVRPWEASIRVLIIIVVTYLIIHFTFKAILQREKKLKDTMKELFSSYQYIGNANRQIDILTNLNKYVTKADFTDQEIISFVVNTIGRIADADFATVFLKNLDEKKKATHRKTKVYYYSERNVFETIMSHLKCETCDNAMTKSDFIIEINKDSEKKCGNFPESFWDTYNMIAFPIIIKGNKKGFLILIHNNRKEISHLDFKLISSLVTQLGTVIE